MNHASILKNLTITWPAGLIIVMVFGMTSPSHAQTGAADQGNSQSKNDESALGQDTPAQSDASSGKSCTEEEPSCEQSAPEQKSFLQKLIKILYGPNTPPGPNTDVDTNISAGGAAGG